MDGQECGWGMDGRECGRGEQQGNNVRRGKSRGREGREGKEIIGEEARRGREKKDKDTQTVDCDV